MTKTLFFDKLFLGETKRGGVVLKKITETEFQRIILGKRLTPYEEAALRESLGLPHNETLPESAGTRKRLLMRAQLKVFRAMLKK